jgi:adenylate cyclase
VIIFLNLTCTFQAESHPIRYLAISNALRRYSMATQDFKRKLTAILSADVKGYSRLMGEDEEATVRTITAHRKVITSVIEKYRGRVVDSPGDNILAEFVSVVDAVQSAVEIQEVIRAKNAELPEERKMEFRIGINLGDVIQEGERIYGDGVNIAARVEGLAEPGGICISGSAYEQIENKLALGYDYIGEHTVKNIVKPIRVYKVPTGPETLEKVTEEKRPVPGWQRAAVAVIIALLVVAGGVAIWKSYRPPTPPIEVASVEKMAFPLPDKPSIAVLPFNNLSGDPEQEYFSDGITEEIIAALGSVPKLFVIARNSTFTYKGKPVKVQQVAEELGVRYVLEGSVKKAGNRIRITAQLIDALSGHHLWAKRYDRNLSDIFAVQDEITREIITAMQVKLTEGEQIRAAAKGTDNLEAYLKYLQANELINQINPQSNAMAKRLAEEAVALDPEYSWAHHVLGRSHMMDVWVGASKSPKESIGKAIELVQKAIALDDTNANAHGLLGFLYSMTKQYDKSVAQAEKAVALNPNSAWAHFTVGKTLSFAGRWKESIPEYKLAIRLNPIPPNLYPWSLGLSYAYTGQYDEGIKWCEKAVRQQSDDLLARIMMTAVYSWSGRDEEARVQAAEVLRIQPKFTIKGFEKKLTYKRQEDRERFLGALRKAGLPDKPTLPLPDKPSIAVLPFNNLSGDPEQEYFSDGITEQIITALSKISSLFVIARNSTFTYKGKPVRVQQVSQELGVRYVLEGSVQKSGDRVRVNAQLIDAIKGNHLWSETYDRELKDIFSVQDDITQKILAALQVQLTHGEQVRVWARGTENLQAYLKILQSREKWIQMNQESNALARQLAEESIALDPDYAFAYMMLAATHMMDVFLGSSKSPKDSIKRAIALNKKVLALDDSLPNAHSQLGLLYTMTRQHDKGVAEAKRGVELDPNSASAHRLLGITLSYAGRPEEAIPVLKKAIRLEPFTPGVYYQNLGAAYRNAGQCDEAISAYEEALRRASSSLRAQVGATAAYSICGREEEARAAAVGVLRINPNFSCDYYAKKTLPYKNQADIDRVIGALRRAGLK